MEESSLTGEYITVEKISAVIKGSKVGIGDKKNMVLMSSNGAEVSIENEQVKFIGDPTETALVELAYKHGVDKRDLEKMHCRMGEVPFDSDRKLMLTINAFKDQVKALVKGAPDILLNRCKYVMDDSGVRYVFNKG